MNKIAKSAKSFGIASSLSLYGNKCPTVLVFFWYDSFGVYHIMNYYYISGMQVKSDDKSEDMKSEFT